VPDAVVHKIGGGPSETYEQGGASSGTVTAGGGTFVGRPADSPCPAGTEGIKFEDDAGELFQSSEKSIGDGSEQ
jgi:hypothetical protein